jgi:hypothetical protein
VIGDFKAVWSIDDPHDLTEVTPVEESWLDANYHWGTAVEPYFCAVGGFYLHHVGDGYKCQDLYDWHDKSPYGDPNWLTYVVPKWSTSIVNCALRLLYAAVGAEAIEKMSTDLPGQCLSSDDKHTSQVIIWDGAWPRLGGKEFVTRFTIPDSAITEIDEF